MTFFDPISAMPTSPEVIVNGEATLSPRDNWVDRQELKAGQTARVSVQANQKKLTG